VGGITFFDNKIEASEKKIIELRREDMSRLEGRLTSIEDDIKFIKRFLIENSGRAK